MYPSAHTQGGMIHLRGGRAIFRGGKVPPLPPSKKNPEYYTITPTEVAYSFYTPVKRLM